jgi:transposase
MRRLRPPIEEAVRAELLGALRRSSELRFIHRLHAVLLVGVGCSCGEVADWFGEDQRSIERWVRSYESLGGAGLRERERIGRPARLNLQQLRTLGEDVAVEPLAAGYTHARWSGKLLSLHVEQRYDVKLSVRHCQRLLQRLKD